MPQDHGCLRIAGEQAAVLLDAAWNMDRLPIAIGQIDGFGQCHGASSFAVDAGRTDLVWCLEEWTGKRRYKSSIDFRSFARRFNACGASLAHFHGQ